MTEFSGDKWYFEKGIRTLNQSIGRIIRHSKDFGMIFFLDNRITWRRMRSKLSSWIKKRKIREFSFEKSLRLQEVFFSGELAIQREKRILSQINSGWEKYNRRKRNFGYENRKRK